MTELERLVSTLKAYNEKKMALQGKISVLRDSLKTLEEKNVQEFGSDWRDKYARALVAIKDWETNGGMA